ncbi:N-acetylglucosamine kinase [Desertivirga arenae]|uniref:N-acetylglucosamine kinase n=1 Tax=Desertivirga arenae TaxID=2810309 RepID=UPI001A96C3DA|nr:N-acetylglucosamine kinase [Pedobacter sp. SYSU D00823]
MILVADSGSSKTDWILKLGDTELKEFTTRGINPYFQTDKDICKVLSAYDEIQEYNSRVKEVYFFGEGCTTPDKREIVSNGLSKVFSRAYISVENDALGSAYATCGKKKGFTCILGTASNVAFYDGEQVHEGVHGLGFVFGDEGSGTYFGKKLITDYLYDKMPAHVRKAFKKDYDINKDIVIRNVYQEPLPNFYLASFAKFLSSNRGEEYVESILHFGIEEFIKTHLLPYPTHQSYPCHFVGSIAYHFQDVLTGVCQKHKIKIGKVLSNPIHDLADFLTQT